MPDPRDGQITGHNTENEPLDRAFAREAPDREPAERPSPASRLPIRQAAGETTDTIADSIQESGEDQSAAEEERVLTNLELQPAPASQPGSASAAVRAQPGEKQEHEAGESPDPIQDSTQFGQDNMADRAEERSIKASDSQQ